ncbi:hypothetical protein ROA7450_00544 [Roseovarius albus]|uniref:Uncharacterized protein n=1 Tax=Roseovarius albus TaxID=1247867 RepID=A0A1X6YC78_9RHOB|nr:hypothetical protein [Roseovarius albus]SLN17262.1 hypothetical protein ROA7450_00544 [Roseovarius albus]
MAKETKAQKKAKTKDVEKSNRLESSVGLSMSGNPKDGHMALMEHEDALKTIFGTDMPELAEDLLKHCLKVLRYEEASDENAANDERRFMVAAVADMKPRDAFERLLSVQMAATHVAVVRSARWLANADQLEQAKAHYSGYTKLARAYVSQMEALRKHRNGGKQTVTVQHVNVEDGGQAIVGNVDRGRGQDEK